MSNKVKYGFRNVHYAVITETDTTISYGTPVAIAGGVNVSLDPQGDKTEFYADDTLYYTALANNGYSGTIELAELPDSFKTNVLGWTKDEATGIMTENADSVPKHFALGFEVQGDSKARRTWYLYCTVSRPKDEAATKQAAIEPKTATLDIVVSPRFTDKNVKKTVVDGDGTGYSAFFDKVE